MAENRLMGLLGFSRDLAQGASNSIASNVSAPVDGLAWLMRKAGLPVGEPFLGSDWMARQGLTAQPQNQLAGLLGEVAGGVGPAYAFLKAPQIANQLLSAGGNRLVNSSKNVKIYDTPSNIKQREFVDDYPQANAQPHGSALQQDVDGRALNAPFIAGRRTVGGNDEALGRQGIYDASSLLGATPRTGTHAQLRGDAGRFKQSHDRDGNTVNEIFLRKGMTENQTGNVAAHEAGHFVDALTYGKIPVDGLMDELKPLYNIMNNPAPNMKGMRTPELDGYKGLDVDREYMAEAIRAYMQNPNYIKSVAPRTAARIREYVNANQNLNRVIQFNSAGGIGAAGLLGGGLLGDGQSAEQTKRFNSLLSPMPYESPR